MYMVCSLQLTHAPTTIIVWEKITCFHIFLRRRIRKWLYSSWLYQQQGKTIILLLRIISFIVYCIPSLLVLVEDIKLETSAICHLVWLFWTKVKMKAKGVYYNNSYSLSFMRLSWGKANVHMHTTHIKWTRRTIY